MKMLEDILPVVPVDPVAVALWEDVPPDAPVPAHADGVDLVIVRWGDTHAQHSVFQGRCLHRGVHLGDGRVEGHNLICAVHGWDYRVDTGVSEYEPAECLHRFPSAVVDGSVVVEAGDLRSFRRSHPFPVTGVPLQTGADSSGEDPEFLFHDMSPHTTPEEPAVAEIHELARHGLERTGHHGAVGSMGVPRSGLPSWDGLQFVTAQLARLPLLEDHPVDATTVLGPRARRPLVLDRPLLVSDMSFGALSLEAKVALARGAELAGTGICSGEGGMLPEEQAENSRYLYELASARFGYRPELLARVQGFHFKCGQGAKTGTGGHLPGAKVQGRIAEVRGLDPGTPAVSPARFPEWDSTAGYRDFAAEVRSTTGGIPIGVKLSAQHIEADIDAAVEIGVDYIILDGRGGGTGAAPLIFRDNISVPTLPALARARRHLDRIGIGRDVTLVITGGLRRPADFAKALALGADVVALANSALQAIGCVGMRACATDACPVGIATQQPHLRKRLEVSSAAGRLDRFLRSATELMCVLARACGHDRLRDFSESDLTTFDRDLSHLSGVDYGGVDR